MEIFIEQKTFEAFRRGDRKAADEIISDFYPYASSYIYRMTKNRDISEELVQELFIALWEKRESINSPNHLKGFVYTTGTYIVLNYFRSMKIANKHFSDSNIIDNIYSDSCSQQVESRELLLLVKMMVSKMDEPRKTIFEMKYYSDLEPKEISAKLNIPQPTIYWHLKKALEDVKKIGVLVLMAILMKIH